MIKHDGFSGEDTFFLICFEIYFLWVIIIIIISNFTSLHLRCESGVQFSFLLFLMIEILKWVVDIQWKF